MGSFRKLALFVMAFHLALFGVIQVAEAIQARSVQTDDWCFKDWNAPGENPPSPVITSLSWVAGIWFAIEILRLIAMGGCLSTFLVVVAVVSVLASVAGPMISSITDQGRPRDYLGYSVGGAKDIENFRANILKGLLPQPSDISFEGLFYDYSFETGTRSLDGRDERDQTALFQPSFSRAWSANPLTGERETYLAVGLNSNIKASDFSRKKLNLVVVLDISGSMSSQFDEYYYDRFTRSKVSISQAEKVEKISKLGVAARSINAMLDHLKPDDRFGMVLFDHRAYLAKSLRLVSVTNMPAIKQHILDVEPQGATNFEDGLEMGADLLTPYCGGARGDYENRIIFLTDAQINTGDTDDRSLLKTTRGLAAKGIYSTFIGIGLDFNTELIEAISKIRGANYFSVHSHVEFKKRLAEEFEFLVTPMVFDLVLKLHCPGFAIEKVFGSPEANQATGEIMRVNTLFPSKSTAEGNRGGIILLRLKPTGDSRSGEMSLDVTYETREGDPCRSTTTIRFPEHQDEFYDDPGIRKGVLLVRYGQMLKEWLCSGKVRADRAAEFSGNRVGLGMWERTSTKLEIDSPTESVISRFKAHFRDEMKIIGDSTLDREIGIMENLESRSHSG